MQPPSYKPSKPKTLTLDAWESKSPLSSTANKSLAVMANATAEYERPYPDIFSASKSATPNHPTPFEVPSTPQPQTATFKQHRFITTPQQYLEWFEQIDKSIDSEHESKYQHHLDKLDKELKLHNEMLRGVDLLDKEIATLKSNWNNIDTGTADLKNACQNHLDQRDDLIAAKERLLEKQST